MVKIVNIFKAAGVWFATIWALYGNKDVKTASVPRWSQALAVSRSPEGGEQTYGMERVSLSHGGAQMGRTPSPVHRGGGGTVSYSTGQSLGGGGAFD